MGYLIGGKDRGKIITSGLDEEFRTLTNVPVVSPVRGANLLKSGDNNLKKSYSSTIDTQRSAPLFNDPRYTSSTLAIPSDSRSLNGLYRFFAETDPIVGSAIKLHTDLACADLRLGTCEDPGIQQHFEEMWDRINGVKTLCDSVSEYHEIGDNFLFGAFNEADYMWEQFAILNPDYVKIEGSWINSNPLIKLIPDEALKKLVHSKSPRYLYDQLPPEIIKYVLFNQEIPLDSNNVFHLAHAKRPYELRGRSLIKRILKTLMLEDRFNQANFALATRHAVPLTVVKVGDPNSLEEDHLITYKEGEELKICSFEDFWNTYSGNITYYDDKEVKDVSHHNLYTQALDEEGNYVWNLIENVLRHPTPEDIIKVSTPHGSIRSTTGHGFIRLNPDTLDMEAVTPEVLQQNPYSTLLTMNNFKYDINSDKVFDIPISEDLSYLIGLWTADGTLKDVEGPTFAISNSDIGLQNYVLDLPNRLPEVEKTWLYKKINDTTCNITYLKLKKALTKYYGFTKSVKKTGIEKIPNELLFNVNDKIVGACFAGIIDGDGWFYKESISVGVSCGASKIYHHMLSLALLAKGINSRIRSSHDGYYELYVTGVDNLKKLYTLVMPYLKHSKKKILVKEKIQLTLNSEIGQSKTNVFYLSDDLIFNLFPSRSVEDFNKPKNKPITLLGKKKYISTYDIEQYGRDIYEKDRLLKFYGVKVDKISKVDKSSKYVYDLMLRDDPHCYLAGNDGWLLTHNSGWLPAEEDLNAVRDMIAAYELDPNFSIIYHWGINVEYYGSNGKMLPIGPELDRIYRLKFIGLQVHEQLLAGQGGSYSQAYVNMEVQRQRYLNLQLKIDSMVHNGWFKTIADLCGFYKVRKAISSSSYSSSSSWGEIKDTSNKEVISSIRDFQDNKEYQNFLSHKKAEASKQVREYVYPKLDWGGMNASNDESLKNYVKWLTDKRPWLVDDGTLARLAKLDRDTQEKAFLRDVERDQQRLLALSKGGLLQVANARGKMFGGSGETDLGGMSDFGGGEIPLGGGSIGVGNEPPAPIGENGPPDSSSGTEPPSGMGNIVSHLKNLESEIRADELTSDLSIINDNQRLLKLKEMENFAVLKEVNRNAS